MFRQWSVWSCLSAYWNCFCELNVHLSLKIKLETPTSTSYTSSVPGIPIIYCKAHCARSLEIQIFIVGFCNGLLKPNGRVIFIGICSTYMPMIRSVSPIMNSFRQLFQLISQEHNFYFIISISHAVNDSLSFTFAVTFSTQFKELYLRRLDNFFSLKHNGTFRS